MFSKFLNLKPEKQEKILEAAIREFADKGFEKASTNEIVREAGISKGILFHYFKSKKTLFLFVYDYAVDLCMEEFLKKVDEEERDIFVKLRQVSSVKIELVNKYSSIFKFLQVAVGEQCNEIKNEIEERNIKHSESSYSKLFNNIDVAKFRDGVDVSKAMNIIMWTLNGLGTSYQENVKVSVDKHIDYDKAFGEMDVYIDILKNAFYK
jgi:TetR/AcrR family transcriptional regulator